MAMVSAVLVGGIQVLTNAGLDVGQVFAFTQYLSLTVAPLAMMAIVIPMVLRGDTSAERILEVYDSVSAVQDQEDAQQRRIGVRQVENHGVVFDLDGLVAFYGDGLDSAVVKEDRHAFTPQVDFEQATFVGVIEKVNDFGKAETFESAGQVTIGLRVDHFGDGRAVGL